MRLKKTCLAGIICLAIPACTSPVPRFSSDYVVRVPDYAAVPADVERNGPSFIVKSRRTNGRAYIAHPTNEPRFYSDYQGDQYYPGYQDDRYYPGYQGDRYQPRDQYDRHYPGYQGDQYHPNYQYPASNYPENRSNDQAYRTVYVYPSGEMSDIPPDGNQFANREVIIRNEAIYPATGPSNPNYRPGRTPRQPPINWENLKTARITLGDREFNPPNFVFNRNVAYRLIIENHGNEVHTFAAPEFFESLAIREAISGREKIAAPGIASLVVDPGARVELIFIPVRLGTFPLVCTQPGHADAGMRGTLEII